MRNKILLEEVLICILISLPLMGSAKSKLDSPTAIRTEVTTRIDKIKTEKNVTNKIKMLRDLKLFFQLQMDEKYKKTESIFKRSLELQQKQLDSGTATRAKEIVKLNKEFVYEKELYEVYVDFDYLFKNIFLLFIDKNKSENVNCSTLGSNIERPYLTSAPEGTLLPYHAKVAIELVDNLCSSLSIE